MQYPSISEYSKALMSSENNFNELSSLRPVLDSYGDPIMLRGDVSGVFKMKDFNTGKLYAVKCFTEDNKERSKSYSMIIDELKKVSSPYIISIRFLERELCVNSLISHEREFPVLVMDWIEGKTFDAYLRENLGNKFSLQRLLYRFCQMSAWLMEQPFAHGNLKPDNILVREDGSLVLVDYDAFYVPAMKEQRVKRLASPYFSLPQYTSQDLNEHIDDFSIATIALSLKTLSLNPKLYHSYATSNGLLLSSTDYYNIGRSAIMREIVQLSYNPGIATLISIFYMVMVRKYFDKEMFSSLISTLIPIKSIIVKGELKTIASKDVGVLQRRQPRSIEDRGKLREEFSLVHIQIAEGVEKIEDRTFKDRKRIVEVTIPKSMKYIGVDAFENCTNIEVINYNAINCSLHGYYYQKNHSEFPLDEDIFFYALDGCSNVKFINIGNSVELIPECAFFYMKKVTKIVIPSSVKIIESNAFCGCSSLIEINILSSIIEIEKYAITKCPNLKKITIPKGTSQKFKKMLDSELHSKLVEQ